MVWMIDDAGTLLGSVKDDEKLIFYEYPEDILPVLKGYEERIRLLETIIKSETGNNEELERLWTQSKELIRKLHSDNLKLQNQECECDVNYWKGIEHAYEKLVHKLHEKNINLERQNQALMDELSTYIDDDEEE